MGSKIIIIIFLFNFGEMEDCNRLTGSNDVKLIKSCGRIFHAVALSTGMSTLVCLKIFFE